jgi:plastocyanin
MKHGRPRPWLLGVILVALGVATLSLGLSRGIAQAQDGAAVSIVDFAFQPASVEVPVGGTVNWANTGAANHTVTANDGAFASGQLNPGAAFSQTFDAAGAIPYFCEIHPQMTGTINVIDAAAPAQAVEAAQTPAPAADAAVTPAAAAEQPAATGAATTQVPRTGVGAMTLDARTSGMALLAALAALTLGAASIASRRAQ